MKAQKFKGYERAVVNDLNNVKSFSLYLCGEFMGFLNCNECHNKIHGRVTLSRD